MPIESINIVTYHISTDQPDGSTYERDSQYIILDLSLTNIGELTSLVYSLQIDRTINSGSLHLEFNSIDQSTKDLKYWSPNLINGKWKKYNVYVDLPKKGSIIETNVTTPAYYNNEARKGINYALYCLPNKTKNIGNVIFEVMINAPWFYSNTGNYHLNMNVLPKNNFKLQSMDIIIKLLDKDSNVIYECTRNGVGINNTNYYAGECYWTNNDNDYTSDMWPTYEQFMNAWDYDIEISNVKEKVIEKITKNSSEFGTHYDNETETFELECINGVTFENNSLHINPNSYIICNKIFDTINNFTLEIETKWISTYYNAYPINIGDYSNGYGLAFEDGSKEHLRLHYGSQQEVTTEWKVLNNKSLITIIKKDKNLKFYINNILCLEINDNYNITLENAKLKFNNENQDITTPMESEIYAIRYYDYILTEEECAIHYNNFISENNV